MSKTMRRRAAPRPPAEPAQPFHPGEILLEEFLVPGGLSQAAFAERVGWTRARLNEFIKGKRGVTAEAALDLAEALGTSARLWKAFAQRAGGVRTSAVAGRVYRDSAECEACDSDRSRRTDSSGVGRAEKRRRVA